ncbi:hypothetical protein [Thetidibacter halocola]|uniref:Uncharacterized protein n=1 Tax=Thetidibacter halocola TaxID=2827239 RepID=A0A8J7WH50_9RHOB|nr:hypothetical protein [Thetidibacter halocola]MBS0126329.1 hypothetical protein [Thetidibacter halocola]
MSFRFITSVLSVGALIAAVSAAPAKAADADDVGRFLGAAATLFIIGKIIQSETRDDRREHAHSVSPRREVVTPRHQPPRPEPARRTQLPRECAIAVDSSSTNWVMGSRCLDRNYRGARRLPQSCLVTLRGSRHDRDAYSMRCLRGHGFEVAWR